MSKKRKSSNWPESDWGQIAMCLLTCFFVAVGVVVARAAEQPSDVRATARQLQLEGARLQLQGKLDEAVKKYRESTALQPDPRLDNLIKQLEPKVSKKEEGAPVGTVAAEPQTPSVASQPVESKQPASAESQPTYPAAQLSTSPVIMSQDMLYKQGEEAFLSSDYKKSLDVFEIAVKKEPNLINDPDVICMMTQSAEIINDIDKYKKYSEICHKHEYLKKITGNFVKIEKIEEKSTVDYIICIKINNGKIFCDGINFGTKIYCKGKIIFDYINTHSDIYEKTNKMHEILYRKIKPSNTLDLYIKLGKNSFIKKLDINNCVNE